MTSLRCGLFELFLPLPFTSMGKRTRHGCFSIDILDVYRKSPIWAKIRLATIFFGSFMLGGPFAVKGAGMEDVSGLD